jgi:hypothetical protein
MTLKERIDEILSLENNQCWYITRQNLNFKELCFAAYFLEKFQKQTTNTNFQNFFLREALNFSISVNYRQTNNCYYLGLIEKNVEIKKGKYEFANHTETYNVIKNKCQGNFNNVELYEENIIDQIEKIVISHPVDEELERLRNDFSLHPTIFLYKILISIGQLTGNYKISLDEFKKFVGTSKHYFYFTTTIDLIRENRILNSQYKDDFAKINKNLFDGNRFNLLFANLPYLTISRDSIVINDNSVKVLTDKVNFYEKNYDKNFDNWKSLDFQNSSKSIFNFY